MPNLIKPKSPIKNRAIGRLDLPKPVTVAARSIGKLIMGPERQTRRGIGTAVLIGPDIVLVSKHSLNKGIPQAVQFDATGGFYDQGQAFEVDSIISNASYIAQKLGIQHSIGGDLALLKLHPNNNQYPGDIYGFKSIEVTDIQPNDDLYFVGHASGSHQKVSVHNAHPWAPLNDALGANLATKGTHTIRNHASHGVITSVSTHTRRVTIASPSKRQSIIDNPATSNVMVELPAVVSPHYMLTSHAVNDGASGGVYLDKNGHIVGIHCGKVLHPATKTPVNLVYFPWGNATSPFLYIHEQSRKKKNKKKLIAITTTGRQMLAKEFKKVTHTLKNAIHTDVDLKKKLVSVSKIYPQLKENRPTSSRQKKFNWSDFIDEFSKIKQDDYLEQYKTLETATQNNTKPVLLGRQAEVDTIARKNKKTSHYTLNEKKWSWSINLAFIEALAQTSQAAFLATELPHAIIDVIKETATRMNGKRFLDKINTLKNDPSIDLTHLLHPKRPDQSDRLFTAYALEIACFLDLNYQLKEHQKNDEAHRFELVPPKKTSKNPPQISDEVNALGHRYLPTLLK